MLKLIILLLFVAAPVYAQEAPNMYCSCVQTARSFGLDLPRGDAKDLKPNSYPVLGGGVIFNYDGVYHVAYIKSLGESSFTIKEGNFERCKMSQRTIRYDDKNIVGFYYR